MRAKRAGFLIGLMAILSGEMGYGLDSARDTLQDVEGLYVLVEEIPEEFKREGMTLGQVKADVELGLLAAKTPVLPMPSKPDLNTFKNYLYVVIDSVPTPNGIAYSVRLDFNQLSVLEHRLEAGQIKKEYRRHRPGASRMFASTWAAHSFGYLEKGSDVARSVREEVRNLVDRFTGDFRLAQDTKNDPLYQAMGHRLPAEAQVGTP